MSIYDEFILKITNKYNNLQDTLDEVNSSENIVILNNLDKSINDIENINTNFKKITDNIKDIYKKQYELEINKFELIISKLNLNSIKEFFSSNILDYQNLNTIVDMINQFKRDLEYRTYKTTETEEKDYENESSDLNTVYNYLNDMKILLVKFLQMK